MSAVVSAAARRIGHLVPKNTVLFVCDIQETFRSTIFQYPTVIHGARTSLAMAKELEIPVVVTTQYAARLGKTVPELAQQLEGMPNVGQFDKRRFSMLTPEVEQHVQALQDAPKSVLLCGIEGHVCVLQTGLDLLDKGFDVHVVADAVSSSTAFNRAIALERLRQSGAFITSVESALFQLTKDSTHPRFRAISNIVKEHLKVPNGFDTLQS